MSTKELGDHFDIHGGGLDLKFPHHENEIAQTCGATGGQFAEIWMHNGFLNIDNEKMSKSLGNFFTTREVLAKIKHPEVLRFFLLSSHYRGPMNYSPDAARPGRGGAHRLYTALRDVPAVGGELYSPTAATQVFDAAMDDDFNTPEAIAVLQGLARELNTVNANRRECAPGRSCSRRELRALGGVLGILGEDPRSCAADVGSARARRAGCRLERRRRSTRSSRRACRLARRRTGRSRTASATSWPRPA